MHSNRCRWCRVYLGKCWVIARTLCKLVPLIGWFNILQRREIYRRALIIVYIDCLPGDGSKYGLSIDLPWWQPLYDPAPLLLSPLQQLPPPRQIFPIIILFVDLKQFPLRIETLWWQAQCVSFSLVLTLIILASYPIICMPNPIIKTVGSKSVVPCHQLKVITHIL